MIEPNKNNLLIVIPAMNEGETIAEVISKIKLLGYQVLVVNDASSDNTATIARDAGAIVLNLHINLGAWNAMQTGMRYALKNQYSYVITMDADGQHEANEIDTLIQAYIQQPDHHVITGACTARGDLSRKLTWKILRWLTASKIKDLTSGFRLYDQQALTQLVSRKATSLEYQDVGILLLLTRTGLNISEVEVKIHTRQNGQSKIFSSWLKILYYLYYTLLLSTAKLQLIKRFRHHTQVID